MRIQKMLRTGALLAVAACMFVWLGSLTAADLDPKVLSYQLPDDSGWTRSESGVLSKVLYGDPTKEGWYILLAKWEAGRMSHPHRHPNARYITVLSGTWWIGTGPKFDPDNTEPVPAGTFVTHNANQIHYDGAKGEDALLQIVGMGPAPSIPSEE